MKKSNRIRNNLKASDRVLNKEQIKDSDRLLNKERGGGHPELTQRERAEVARERQAQKEADTKSALSKPNELTPLQKKRRERSEAIKEARRIEKENKRKNN